MTGHALVKRSLSPARALSPQEQRLLDYLLDVPAAGFETLRRQARTAFVTGECTCGCATIGLGVDCSVPPAPVEGMVADAYLPRTDGTAVSVLSYVGPDGYLCELEILHADSGLIERLPEPDELVRVRPAI